MLRIPPFIRPLALWALLLLAPPALACTLWGAAGDDASGGTLIAKNRDWAPDHRQYLRLVRPRSGLAYLGLFAEGNAHPGLKAGSNEKGLTIVSASSAVPEKLRSSRPEKRAVLARVLAGYTSVDAVMADADNLFAGSWPDNLLIADGHKMLLVEIGQEDRFSMKLADQGVLTHTNHFLDPALPEYTRFKPGRSSLTRLARITSLLADAPRPLTEQQFAAMSRDQHDGPANSLWRTAPTGATLASWIVTTSPEGKTRLRLIIANPGEAEQHYEQDLDTAFWQRPAARFDSPAQLGSQ